MSSPDSVKNNFDVAAQPDNPASGRAAIIQSLAQMMTEIADMTAHPDRQASLQIQDDVRAHAQQDSMFGNLAMDTVTGGLGNMAEQFGAVAGMSTPAVSGSHLAQKADMAANAWEMAQKGSTHAGTATQMMHRHKRPNPMRRKQARVRAEKQALRDAWHLETPRREALQTGMHIHVRRLNQLDHMQRMQPGRQGHPPGTGRPMGPGGM